MKFLPDPVLGEDGRYLDADSYGKQTTDEARPAAKAHPVPSDTDKKLKNLLVNGKILYIFVFIKTGSFVQTVSCVETLSIEQLQDMIQEQYFLTKFYTVNR